MQGISGMVSSTAGNTAPREKQMKEQNPNVVLSYIARVTRNEGDKTVGVGFGNGAWGCWAVTSVAQTNNRVDAIFRFFDYMVSNEGWDIHTNGIKDIHYSEQNGKKVFTPEYDTYAANRGDYQFFRRYNDVRYSVGPENMDDELAKRLTS